MSSSSQASRKKTVKLVVPPQYYSYGYQDYTGIHDLSETPALLKTIGATAPRVGEMTLLFRGRRIKPEEEDMTFETLMKTVLSLEEEILTSVRREYG